MAAKEMAPEREKVKVVKEKTSLAGIVGKQGISQGNAPNKKAPQPYRPSTKAKERAKAAKTARARAGRGAGGERGRKGTVP